MYLVIILEIPKEEEASETVNTVKSASPEHYDFNVL